MTEKKSYFQQVMSGWGPLIYAGCFAATLSSAISMLVGAPRIFQAVSKDKLFPGHYNVQLIYMKNHDIIVEAIFKGNKSNIKNYLAFLRFGVLWSRVRRQQ